tara:strand:- start:3789 stop:4130 length:342 start_codon:yes stop_codon:yes gene_type:complete
MSRYINRKVVFNSSDAYQDSEIFENRGIKRLYQYSTPKFQRFTKEEYDSVSYETHIWKNGDRYWKLANTYYGDPTLWWVIAKWNFKPTESHVSEGEEIRIPTNLQEALELIRA